MLSTLHEKQQELRRKLAASREKSRLGRQSLLGRIQSDYESFLATDTTPDEEFDRFALSEANSGQERASKSAAEKARMSTPGIATDKQVLFDEFSPITDFDSLHSPNASLHDGTNSSWLTAVSYTHLTLPTILLV